MMKSVFGKFVSMVMVIVITSFIIMLTAMLTLASDYSQGIKEDSVRYLAQRTYLSVNSKHFSDMSSADKTKLLKNYAKTSEDSLILIINAYGDVVYHSELPESGIGKLSSTYLEKISLGTENGIINTTLGGLFNERYIVFPQNLYDENGKFSGAILACTESHNNEFVFRVLSMSLISGLVAICIVFVMTYFLTIKLVDPLKQMSYASKQFARGKFDVKLNIRGTDETAQLAEALNEMARSLQESERQRSNFLANVAHDLRTPMTTIAGFIDGIIDGVIPKEKQNHYLHIIADEVKRLSVLVNKLVELTKLDAGTGNLNLADFDISELLRRIIIGFEQKIEEKKLSIDFDCKDGEGKVHADADAIYQVCYNLFDNAVKFSDQGGKISIRVEDLGKKYAITVKNTGVGIPEEDIPYIFDRFYKADKSRGLDKTGTGLGMFIAKTIINSHNEELSVESVYGEYCSFRFTLVKSATHKGAINE